MAAREKVRPSGPFNKQCALALISLSKAVATLMSERSERHDAKLVQFSPARRGGASSSGTPEA
jgi:hypothetical protein